MRSSNGGGSGGAATRPETRSHATVRPKQVLLALALLAGVHGSAALGLPASWTNLGPAGAPSILVLAVSPASSSVLYAGTAGAGVFTSKDAGASWMNSSTGIASPTVFSLVFDPVNMAVVYAGTTAGVFKTANGAQSWTQAGVELVGRSVSALAIDPLSPGVIYAGTDQGGFKSIDGGASWLPMTNGLPQVKVLTLATDSRVAGTVYAGTFGDLLGRSLFKSTTSGGTWTSVNQGLANNVVTAIAIDLSASTTVYAGTMTFGPAPGVPPPPSGAVFRSDDGGATWSKVITGLTSTRGITPPVNALVIDPASPTHIYAGTAGAGAFQSTDGATTWTPINRGLTDLNVQSLQLTPAAPTVLLYAATSSGVFKSTPDSASEAFIGTLPVVISAPGQLGAMFRTALQLSNPADPCSPPCSGNIFGHIVLHPAGAFTAADPAFTFAITPGTTAVYGDIVRLFERSGLGSLDIFLGSATEPTILATLANVGAGGNYGFGERLVRPSDILATGDVGVLIAPGVLNHRLNVGIRTFDTLVVLRISVRSAGGQLMRTLTKQYPAAYMEQVAASTFLDSLDASPPGAYAIGLSDSLRIQVLAGNLVIYGADADNQTNDPSLQVVERIR